MQLKAGDRVKRSDADTATVPAYRDMRATVVALGARYVSVAWDCDGGEKSLHRPEDLALAEDE